MVCLAPAWHGAGAGAVRSRSQDLICLPTCAAAATAGGKVEVRLPLIPYTVPTILFRIPEAGQGSASSSPLHPSPSLQRHLSLSSPSPRLLFVSSHPHQFRPSSYSWLLSIFPSSITEI
ncbi:hypothetical protein BDW75DRAFT_99437 [Aspergillus navahoensis]